MTILVQFENNNWYTEAIAIMPDDIYSHPKMQNALDEIAKENGFDFVSECERSRDFDALYSELIDAE